MSIKRRLREIDREVAELPERDRRYIERAIAGYLRMQRQWALDRKLGRAGTV